MGLCSEYYWSGLIVYIKLKCALVAFLETSYRTVALAVQPRLIKVYSLYLKKKKILGVHLTL